MTPDDAVISAQRLPFSHVGNSAMTAEALKEHIALPLGHSPVKPTRQANDVQRSRVASSASASALSQSEPTFGLVDALSKGMNITYQQVIVCPKSIALLFGRTRASPGENLEPHSADVQSEPHDQPMVGGVPVRRVLLSNSAKHISRDHCIIYHTPFSGSVWAVKILGQNGLIVDGVRHRPGSILRLVPNKTIVDFFGVRCLFAGQQIPLSAKSSASLSIASREAQQDGRSPSKANARPSVGTQSTVEQLRAAVAGVVQSGQKTTKFLGNSLKRPRGAPLSPPTSSPAPFDAASSPSRRPQPLTSSPTPFSAGLDDDVNDEEEDDDEEENLSRAISPTLNRSVGKVKAAGTSRHDDSGVLLHPNAQDDNSEDEASQALALSRKVQKVPSKTQRERKRTSSGMLVQEESSGPTRSSTSSPRPRNDAKRVKFTASSGGQSGTATTSSSTRSAPVLASTMQAVQMHYRTLVKRLASTYDVQGLLAGAIVFHRTATISATEAVRSVLSSNPGLMRGEVGPEKDGKQICNIERGQTIEAWTHEGLVKAGLVKEDEVDKERVETWQRKAWRECLEASLMEGDCFGIIQRAGKDASGNPLECWYYYDKERDSDAQRAANLGAFVKPMRAALKTHKPIFWRKSAYGTTSDDAVKATGTTTTTAANSNVAAGATESQWGSSGSTLKSALLSSHGFAGDGNADGGDSVNKASATLPSPSLGAWEETQMTEDTEQTWDREGDMDFEIGTPRRTVKRRR